MAGDQIFVEHSGLSQAAQDFQNHASVIEEKINDVRKTLELLKENWRGNAILQVDDLLMRWQQEATNVQSLLSETAGRISKANVSYGELESDISRSFQ